MRRAHSIQGSIQTASSHILTSVCQHNNYYRGLPHTNTLQASRGGKTRGSNGEKESRLTNSQGGGGGGRRSVCTYVGVEGGIGGEGPGNVANIGLKLMSLCTNTGISGLLARAHVHVLASNAASNVDTHVGNQHVCTHRQTIAMAGGTPTVYYSDAPLQLLKPACVGTPTYTTDY